MSHRAILSRKAKEIYGKVIQTAHSYSQITEFICLFRKMCGLCKFLNLPPSGWHQAVSQKLDSTTEIFFCSSFLETTNHQSVISAARSSHEEIKHWSVFFVFRPEQSLSAVIETFFCGRDGERRHKGNAFFVAQFETTSQLSESLQQG